MCPRRHCPPLLSRPTLREPYSSSWANREGSRVGTHEPCKSKANVLGCRGWRNLDVGTHVLRLRWFCTRREWGWSSRFSLPRRDPPLGRGLVSGTGVFLHRVNGLQVNHLSHRIGNRQKWRVTLLKSKPLPKIVLRRNVSFQEMLVKTHDYSSFPLLVLSCILFFLSHKKDQG